jgi:two-component system CheB/CheR fusion protein
MRGDKPASALRAGPTSRRKIADLELVKLDAALARLGGGTDPFASAVWATRMPIVVTNPRLHDNPMVFVNDAFCHLTGYTRAEMLGRNCRCMQGALTDPESVERLRNAVRDHLPLDVEIRNYRKDGTAFWNRLHLVPLHDADGTLSYFFASQIDVTLERVRLTALQDQNSALLAAMAAREQADAANAEKSRFLAVASHDIRQPLQSLVLLQGVLAQSVQGAAAEKLVARLGQTLDSMSSMLNALLDLNQIEAGAVRPEIVDLWMDDVLNRVRDGFLYDAQAKGLCLHVVPCGVHVRSDPRLLEQMVRNLLANALKYTKHGKILLGCRRLGASMRIEVWDTGIGIPAAAIGTIFREYHQLDNSSRRSARGLGLGLAIVRRFAALLDHAVTVRSTPNKGSMFAITVPRVDERAAVAPVRRAMEKDIPANADRPATILLVDDDPESCDIISAVLAHEGYRVIVACDGVRALQMMEAAPAQPDLLLTDSRLPADRSGPGFIALLRQRLMRDIPVVILTGMHAEDATGEARMGNSLWLTKPVRPRELGQAIARMLANPIGAPDFGDRVDSPVGHALAGTVIFVVDDSDEVSQAIRTVIETEGGEVETFDSSEAFLAFYQPGRKACLLVDAYLPGMSGMDLLRQLRAGGDTLPAIMITGNSDVAMAVEAMKAGASDFIEKPVAAAELLAGVSRAIALGHDSNRLASWREAASGHLVGLTARQRQVMTMVLAGHPSKNIAADLGISQRTVENHRASIMRKAGTKSLPALARLALAADWTGANGPLATA